MNRNRKSKLAFRLEMIGAFLLAFAVVGCNANSSPEVAEATPMQATTETAADGCCGKCKTETASDQEGCCGKCKTETGQEECCGQDSKSADGSAKGCSENCNACAEGKSESCQCGDAPTTETGKDSSKDASHDDHVHSNREDRDIFHYLLENHEKISRRVKNLDNGVETITESDDAKVVEKIQEHVASMHGRMKDVRRLRMWDDLFVKIFEHADEIEMKVTNTKNGVKVVETSDNPEVAKLIQQHAVVVSGFSKYGFGEARKNHPVGETAEKKDQE